VKVDNPALGSATTNADDFFDVMVYEIPFI